MPPYLLFAPATQWRAVFQSPRTLSCLHSLCRDVSIGKPIVCWLSSYSSFKARTKYHFLCEALLDLSPVFPELLIYLLTRTWPWTAVRSYWCASSPFKLPRVKVKITSYSWPCPQWLTQDLSQSGRAYIFIHWIRAWMRVEVGMFLVLKIIVREIAQPPLPRSAVKIFSPPTLSSAFVVNPILSGWKWYMTFWRVFILKNLLPPWLSLSHQ